MILLSIVGNPLRTLSEKNCFHKIFQKNYFLLPPEVLSGELLTWCWLSSSGGGGGGRGDGGWWGWRGWREWGVWGAMA